MYRYSQIAQNMTTSKLMNPFKIGAGVLSKDHVYGMTIDQ